MAGKSAPRTPALRFLDQAKVPYTLHVIPYVDRGGTAHTAATLGVDEHMVIKTLILENNQKRPLCILMHGDREVSTKQLARHRGDKSIAPCAPAVAQRHSGYQVGGTSPFGLRKQMPLYAQTSIRDLDELIINGGARGVLVQMRAAVLDALLAPTWVDAAQAP